MTRYRVVLQVIGVVVGVLLKVANYSLFSSKNPLEYGYALHIAICDVASQRWCSDYSVVLIFCKTFKTVWRGKSTAGLPPNLCKCGGSAPPFFTGGFNPAFARITQMCKSS